MGKLKYLVLHCTATPCGREVTADEIRRWHTSAPPCREGLEAGRIHRYDTPRRPCGEAGGQQRGCAGRFMGDYQRGKRVQHDGPARCVRGRCRRRRQDSRGHPHPRTAESDGSLREGFSPSFSRRGDCRPQPAGGESLPLVRCAGLVEINRNKPIKKRMK